MNEQIGLVGYGSMMGEGFLKPYSDETHWEIDEVVRGIVKDQYAAAKELLQGKKHLVEALGDLLLEKETINLKDIIGVLGPRPAGMTEVMEEYLVELNERLEKEEQEAAAAAEKQEQEEDKNEETDDEEDTKTEDKQK